MADELKRRLVHVSGTAIPALYVVGISSWRTVIVLAVGGMLIAGVLEVLRLTGQLEWRIYDVLTRDYEADNPAGYALYFVGMAIVAIGFRADPNLAVAAILMLTIGDPISGLLGSTGPEGVKGTSVLVIMFLVCLALAAPFLIAMTTVPIGLTAAVMGAVAATVADGVKPVIAGYVIDDNVTIPLGGAVAMWVGVEVLPVI